MASVAGVGRSPVLRFAKNGAAGGFVSGACSVSESAAACPVMGSPLRENVRRGSWARLFGASAGMRGGLLVTGSRRGGLVRS